MEPVATRHRRDRGCRIEALGHDPGLLFVGPAPPTANPGDDLHPAEDVGVRTIRTTMITHRSRARSNPLGPSILNVLSQPARCPSDDAYGAWENAEVVCRWAGGRQSRHALVRSVRRTVQLSRHAELLAHLRGLHAQG